VIRTPVGKKNVPKGVPRSMSAFSRLQVLSPLWQQSNVVEQTRLKAHCCIIRGSWKGEKASGKLEGFLVRTHGENCKGGLSELKWIPHSRESFIPGPEIIFGGWDIARKGNFLEEKGPQHVTWRKVNLEQRAFP